MTAFWIAHKVLISTVFWATVPSVIASLITALTNYPKTETWLHTVLGILSFLQHADADKRMKLPLTRLRAPAAPKLQVPLTAIVMALGAGLFLNACATLSWTTPVVYVGPTVVPIEEVSAKSPTPAVATGFQETVGLGQFEFQGHEWDAIDLGVVELGGLAMPNASPSGMLQLGGKIGTLNGIIGLVLAADVADATNTGLAQGGNTGLIYGASIDVQALVTWLDQLAPVSNAAKTRIRLPRGGL
jgi:hypothetical protein